MLWSFKRFASQLVFIVASNMLNIVHHGMIAKIIEFPKTQRNE